MEESEENRFVRGDQHVSLVVCTCTHRADECEHCMQAVEVQSMEDEYGDGDELQKLLLLAACATLALEKRGHFDWQHVLHSQSRKKKPLELDSKEQSLRLPSLFTKMLVGLRTLR